MIRSLTILLVSLVVIALPPAAEEVVLRDSFNNDPARTDDNGSYVITAVTAGLSGSQAVVELQSAELVRLTGLRVVVLASDSGAPDWDTVQYKLRVWEHSADKELSPYSGTKAELSLTRSDLVNGTPTIWTGSSSWVYFPFVSISQHYLLEFDLTPHDIVLDAGDPDSLGFHQEGGDVNGRTLELVESDESGVGLEQTDIVLSDVSGCQYTSSLGNPYPTSEQGRFAMKWIAEFIPTGESAGSTSNLIMERSGTDLNLSWGRDCGLGDRYGLYRGDLASGYSSITSDTCGITTRSTTVPMGLPAGEFFLVVSEWDSAEGSYGKTSAGERAPAVSSCQPPGVIDVCANPGS